MQNIVSFNVKCPVCGVSLMDTENKIDKASSIRLHIKSGENEGTINLSSIYGSYNYICDFNPTKNVQAEFFCPSCNSVLISDKKCKICSAPMVPLYLDIGGEVDFCSRAGCKNHYVQFDDLVHALNKFYQEYQYPETDFMKDLSVKNISELNIPKNLPEILETGTFLHAYCPYCNRSLIDSNTIKLKIVNDYNEEGFILLSPFLNVYDKISTILIKENKTIRDIRCPHCNESLIRRDKLCEVCNSPVAMVSVSARTKLIDFYICSKEGCKWHGLSDDDENEIKLEDSMEW